MINSLTKICSLIFKTYRKESEEYISKEDTQMGMEYVKKCSSLLVIRETT